jgi:hypothetical protein
VCSFTDVIDTMTSKVNTTMALSSAQRMVQLQQLLDELDDFLGTATAVRDRVSEEIEILEAAAAAKARKQQASASAAKEQTTAARQAYRPLLSAVTSCLTETGKVAGFKHQGSAAAARFKEVVQTRPVPFATAKEYFESYMRACQGGLCARVRTIICTVILVFSLMKNYDKFCFSHPLLLCCAAARCQEGGVQCLQVRSRC